MADVILEQTTETTHLKTQNEPLQSQSAKEPCQMQPQKEPRQPHLPKGERKKKKRISMSTKDILKCVAALVAIALVAGILLGAINYFTYTDSDAAIKQKIADHYSVTPDRIVVSPDRAVNEADSRNFTKAVYGVKNSTGGIDNYVYYTSGSGGKGGAVELLIYLSSSGVIKDITTYAHGETASYFKGVEVQNRPKYIGVNVNDIKIFNLVKPGDETGDRSDISAVSKATMSSTAYNNAVNAAVYSFKNYKAAKEVGA